MAWLVRSVPDGAAVSSAGSASDSWSYSSGYKVLQCLGEFAWRDVIFVKVLAVQFDVDLDAVPESAKFDLHAPALVSEVEAIVPRMNDAMADFHVRGFGK
ncbi:MAG: hypothetical protein ACKO0Z_12265 [Betaproteobacteria bacterium]